MKHTTYSDFRVGVAEVPTGPPDESGKLPTQILLQFAIFAPGDIGNEDAEPMELVDFPLQREHAQGLAEALTKEKVRTATPEDLAAIDKIMAGRPQGGPRPAQKPRGPRG